MNQDELITGCLNGNKAVDQTNYTYGLAFVMLAYSSAIKMGLHDYKAALAETWDILEQRFWQPEAAIYADEASADWSVLSPYRGQNANMHACEACLAAYEATEDNKYLDKAYQLAQTVTVKLAAMSDGFNLGALYTVP